MYKEKRETINQPGFFMWTLQVDVTRGCFEITRCTLPALYLEEIQIHVCRVMRNCSELYNAICIAHVPHTEHKRLHPRHARSLSFLHDLRRAKAAQRKHTQVNSVRYFVLVGACTAWT
jgi:hypothetical protein